MNKALLAETIAERTGLSKKQAEDVLETFVDIIKEQLITGEEVTLAGFGTFMAKHRSARMGVNPQNPSERIQVPEVVIPKFKAGKNLKDSLKNASVQ
jgi:DNA-binding protein HU-beta